MSTESRTLHVDVFSSLCPLSSFDMNHKPPSTCSFLTSLCRILGVSEFTIFSPLCFYLELPAGTVTSRTGPSVSSHGDLHLCVYCLSDRSLLSLQNQYFILSDPHPNLSAHSPHLALALNVPGLHDAGRSMKLVYSRSINMPNCRCSFNQKYKFPETYLPSLKDIWTVIRAKKENAVWVIIISACK